MVHNEGYALKANCEQNETLQQYICTHTHTLQADIGVFFVTVDFLSVPTTAAEAVGKEWARSGCHTSNINDGGNYAAIDNNSTTNKAVASGLSEDTW